MPRLFVRSTGLSAWPQPARVVSLADASGSLAADLRRSCVPGGRVAGSVVGLGRSIAGGSSSAVPQAGGPSVSPLYQPLTARAGLDWTLAAAPRPRRVGLSGRRIGQTGGPGTQPFLRIRPWL